MTKQIIQNLISDLHNRFGDDLTSSQQLELMEKLRNHAHAMNQDAPVDPDFEETLTLLLEDLEIQHPQAAGIIREVMATLGNMGI